MTAQICIPGKSGSNCALGNFELETLEPRAMLSAGTPLRDAPTITGHMVHGILVIEGTNGSEEILVGIEQDHARIFIQSDATYLDFDLAGVKGVFVDGLNGDDSLEVDNWHGALHLPITLNGGDGNDFLRGPDGRDRSDHVSVTSAQYGDLPVTMLGGAGDDTLYGGLGPDHFDGGKGHNLYEDVRADDTLVQSSLTHPMHDDQPVLNAPLAPPVTDGLFAATSDMKGHHPWD